MTHPLHDRVPVVDLHNDLILLVDHFDRRGARDHFAEFWRPELQAGGVDVQVLPICIEEQFQSEGALRRTLLLVERVHELAEEHPDIQVCLTGADVRRTRADGGTALILALEGAHALGQDPALIRTMHRVGVRVVSLAHLWRTHLADGSALDDSSRGGLTPQGIEVVQEMERLGIIFDVSHLGRAGVDDVLEVATRPMMATHSACRAVMDVHRNLSDEQLRGIAAVGGVVGVAAAIPPFIDPSTPTVDRVVDHIEHLASVTSFDHIALGPDFVDDYFDQVYGGWVVTGIDPPTVPTGLRRPSDLPRLTDAMIARGIPEDDIVKVLGGNALRVMDAVMGVPAS